MTQNILTPNSAAKIANVSRSAIMRALASRTLPAQRDNKNRWLIKRSDLDTWSASRPDQDRTGSLTVRPVTQDVSDMSADLAAIKSELATSRAEVAGLRDRLADTQAERDRLTALLNRALEPRPGIISRIFGR